MITEDLLKISSNQVVSCVDNNSDVSNSFCVNENEEIDSGFTVSPSGHKYYVPFCVEDTQKPFVNKSFQSMKSGIAFYKEYASLCGFSARRSAEKRHSSDGTIISKYLVCNRAGFLENNKKGSDGSKNQVGKKRRTMFGRCGCEAKMVLRFAPGNIYYILNFIEAHNHPLVPEECRHFLRGSRQMSTCHMNFVFDASKVNIGTSKSFRLMKEMVGSYENVGATSRDFRNFDRDLKGYVGAYDGQMIIEKFKVKKETDSAFFYDYDVDSDGRLTKLFWADCTARRNYELYGDAVSFDPTFNTNKYNMVFAPFTGVDKHNKCVTFAATLLSKEDVTHFSWAFEALLKAMGRNPVCIVTDQCPAMKQAVPAIFKATNEFPASRHRLCRWHITEKFPTKLGNFLCKETDFMERIKPFIWSSTIEPDEFEEGWKTVMKEFKLEDHVWLSEMYNMRESWIPAYFRDKPMYGLIRTTSRSESENFFFSQFHQNGSTLSKFYIRFESAMDKQRNEIKRLNHECTSAKPVTISKFFLEDDAAELYTRAIFYKVQEEILAARDDMRMQTIGPQINGIKCYEMRDVKMKDRLFKVEVSKTHANCSCKKFVMCGLLCRHAFCALNHFEVNKIPRRLVLNRWMKNAENKASSQMFSVSNEIQNMDAVSVELTSLWFNFHKCVTKAGSDLPKLKFVTKTIKDLDCALGDDGVVFSKRDFLGNIIGKQPSGKITIHPPVQCKNKGSGLKRLVSEREKAITKAKKKKRECKLCKSVVHDKRTCPRKDQIEVVRKDQVEAVRKDQAEAVGAKNETEAACPKKNQVVDVEAENETEAALSV